MPGAFQTLNPRISGNTHLRIPQREGIDALIEAAQTDERELAEILPVGCGKSGLIALAAFAFKAKRALVVAPGLRIAKQLAEDFDPANPGMFYKKCKVLDGSEFPEPVEIRGTTTNRSDLEDSDVVITNIQQLQGMENRWLENIPSDFFDLLVFDEGHHGVAQSWLELKRRFPNARVVNFSATPKRADGQLMSGRIVYTFPVFRAIQEGYVKRLKAVVLNPRTLRYVRREDGNEIEVSLDEVRRLGEEDADFRRSIVTSKATLDTIVDASIRELQRLRGTTGDNRLKIISSALNYEHCNQIVQAYSERGLRAAYVHSKEDSKKNDAIYGKLDRHELDVIVQVRKLGEGFDHPFLSVAAVFSIFSNLSPFVQFVGRVMRVIEQNAPMSPKNHASVVFHAGANVARQWEDFQTFSEADREYFDELLPTEGLDFSNSNEISFEPVGRHENTLEIQGQSGILIQEIPLIKDDPEAMMALRILKERGYSTHEIQEAYEELEPIYVTKQRQRQAMRGSLDMRVKTTVGRLLGERGVNPEGRDLDKQRLSRTNFVFLKCKIDKEISSLIGRKLGERCEFSREEYAKIDANFGSLVQKVVEEVFNG